jgi:ribose transport system substrate-binding protein
MGHILKSAQNLSTFQAEDIYEIEAVRRACELLKAFESDEEVLRLRDLVARTGINTTTAFRLLHTLEQQGFLERVRRHGYRSKIKAKQTRRYKFGYASQGEDCGFAQEWTESIVRAAGNHDVDLISLDNGFDPGIALQNADCLVQAKVDLAIEHQFNERIAPAISAKFRTANIPLIAMGAGHPGATYFGGNNYAAGLIGGRALGQWAKLHWRGKADELALIELSMAGPLLRSRLKGVEVGVKQVLPDLKNVVYLTGKGQFGGTMEVVRRHLRTTRSRYLLLGAVNDPCALGALRAFEEAGWDQYCAVMGQGGAIEARTELRRPLTRLIGTVGFFPETYGESIMRLAHNLLSNQSVPPAVFTKHQLITADNVDQYYPQDPLLSQLPAHLAGKRNSARLRN